MAEHANGHAEGIQVAQPQPVLVIQIHVMPDLNVGVVHQGTLTQPLANLATETAKQLLLGQLAKAKDGPAIVQAPPGARF